MLIEKLSKNFLDSIRDFDCDDTDLNDFLLKDSFVYEKTLLAKTYLILDGQCLVGFFSLLNDKIQKSDDISKREWNSRVKKDLTYQKNN